MAILLGSGSPGESAIELPKRIVQGHGGKIELLKGSNFSSLCKYKGMGIAKDGSILAALELSSRIYECHAPESKTVYLTRKPFDKKPPRLKFN